MKLTPPQRRAFEKSAAQCQELRARLELFERLAQIDPGLAPRARELREMYDHQELLCATALELDRRGG